MYGCHTSLEKTLLLTYERAMQRGCKAFQIFWGGNQTFKRRSIDPVDLKKVKDKKLDEQARLFIHAPYVYSLINNFPRTMESLKVELKLVGQLNNSGVVIHSGSYKSIGNLSEAVKIVAHSIKELYKSDSSLGMLLLENTAGQGSVMPEKLETIGEILKLVDNPKVGFCFDTCHGFGSGVADLRKKEAIDKLYDDINQHIGIEKLKLIHLNDSRFPFASKKDGHALLRKGFIWKNNPETLRYFLEKFKAVPAIAETVDWDWDKEIIRKSVETSYSLENIKNVIESRKLKIDKSMHEGLANVLAEFMTEFGADLKKLQAKKKGKEIDIEVKDVTNMISKNKKYAFLEEYADDLKKIVQNICDENKEEINGEAKKEDIKKEDEEKEKDEEIKEEPKRKIIKKKLKRKSSEKLMQSENIMEISEERTQTSEPKTRKSHA